MIWILALTGLSVASWALVALVAPALSRATFFGMLGPLVAVVGTSALVERTSRVNPAGVASAMMAAFVVKMLFFGVYAVAVVKWAAVQNRPFLLSFTGYFVALYAAEALHLRRLAGRLT